MRTIKCVFVGDGCVGKTYILETYKTKIFPTEYSLPSFNEYKFKIQIDNEFYMLEVKDTPGQEDCAAMRRYVYDSSGVDVFVVCFSVDTAYTAENVELAFIPEIKNFSKDIPIILLGTKIDTRGKTPTMSTKDGENLAKKLKAIKYFECSAKTQEGIDTLFKEITLIILKLSKQKSSCEIS